MNHDLRAALANLDAGVRRLATALDYLATHLASQAAAPWSLSEDGWILATPDGRKLQLGAAERALLMTLARQPRRQVQREQLVDEISRALKGDRYNAAALSVMISRLRKKIGESGLDLPLHAVRGQGYALAVDIELSVPDRGVARQRTSHKTA